MLVRVLSLFVVLACARANAQITPPGMGSAASAAWSAVGIKQALDAAQRRQYVGYLGFGASSDRLGHNPYARPNIFVFNHEVYDHFRDYWQYSLALSYRRQDALEHESGVWQELRLQELRLYGRYSFVIERARVKLLSTFRPELRGFVQPDFRPLAQPLQLRFRLKNQLTWQLDARGAQRLSGAAELLASISRSKTTWGDFGYRESRLSAFYSFSPASSFVIDIGYMNDLLGRPGALTSVHYFAIDLIWLDPFRKIPRPAC